MKRPFYVTVAAWMLGELMAGDKKEWFFVPLCFVFICYILFFLEDFRSIFQDDRKKAALLVAWIVLVCLTGFFSMNHLLEKYHCYEEVEEGEEVSFLGNVVSSSENQYGVTVVFLIEQAAMEKSGKKLETGVQAQVSFAENPKLKNGQKVFLVIRKEDMENARNEGNFDEQAYYYSLKTALTGTVKRYQMADGSYHRAAWYLQQLREVLCENIDKSCGQEEAAVIKSIVYGNRADLTAEQRSLFQKNGIAHILAVSGLHMSIVGLGIYKILRKRFSFGFSAFVGGFLLAGFGIMIGFSVSLKRAFTMMLLRIGADVTGRTFDMRNALGFSALIILIENPYSIYSTSFLLSFSAVLAVGVIWPEVENWLLAGIKNKRERRKRKQYLGFFSGIMLFVFQMPVIANLFYQVPTYSVVINLLVIPLLSLLFVSGMAASFAACLWVPAGVFISGMAVYVVRFYQWICDSVGKLPDACHVVGHSAGEIIFTFYVFVMLCMAVLILQRKREKKERPGESPVRRIFIMLFTCLFFSLLIYIRPERKGLSFSVIDVGQGDCILAECENGVTMLIDGGSSSVGDVAKYRMLPYIKYRGVKKLDYVWVSHGDEDHINGIVELLQNRELAICNLILGINSRCEEKCQELIHLAETNGVRIIYVKRGDVLQNGSMTMRILNPAEEKAADCNDASLVFEMNYYDFSACFTGDISEETEKELLPYVNSAEMLKVAHHGSKYSSSEAFLDKTTPAFAVISCGEGNRYGHPHKETLNRLKANCGSFRTTLNGGRICIDVEPPDQRGHCQYSVNSFLKAG